MERRVRKGIVFAIDRFNHQLSVITLDQIDEEQGDYPDRFPFYGAAPSGIVGRPIDLVQYIFGSNNNKVKQEIRTSDDIASTGVLDLKEIKRIRRRYEDHVQRAIRRRINEG